MIAGMGMPELMVILLVVLVLFGPKNLPKLGKTLGETVKNVREGMEEDDTPKAAQVAPAQDPKVSEASSDSDAQ